MKAASTRNAPVTVGPQDIEAARQFIADEWPSWDHDHQTVQASLAVLLARHRACNDREADIGTNADAHDRLAAVFPDAPADAIALGVQAVTEALVVQTSLTTVSAKPLKIIGHTLDGPIVVDASDPRPVAPVRHDMDCGLLYDDGPEACTCGLSAG